MFEFIFHTINHFIHIFCIYIFLTYIQPSCHVSFCVSSFVHQIVYITYFLFIFQVRQQVLLVVFVFCFFGVIFMRYDYAVNPILAPGSASSPLDIAMKNQFEMTTPDYYADYDGAIKDEGDEERIGGIDHLLNVTNNLTDLVGKVNVNQPYFKDYINILRKKVVPVDLMEVVSTNIYISG